MESTEGCSRGTGRARTRARSTRPVAPCGPAPARAPPMPQCERDTAREIERAAGRFRYPLVGARAASRRPEVTVAPARRRRPVIAPVRGGFRRVLVRRATVSDNPSASAASGRYRTRRLSVRAGPPGSVDPGLAQHLLGQLRSRSPEEPGRSRPGLEWIDAQLAHRPASGCADARHDWTPPAGAAAVGSASGPQRPRRRPPSVSTRSRRALPRPIDTPSSVRPARPRSGARRRACRIGRPPPRPGARSGTWR